MVLVTDATKKDKFRKTLNDELSVVKENLLNIECGLTRPEELPLAPQFYIEKKSRIEALLWALDVEDKAEKYKQEKDLEQKNASDQNS